MAFDGTMIACIADELNNTILNGRISKVAQPEKDSLLLTIKKDASQYRLLISVNASLPMLYLTDKNLPSPPAAPAFCMLLRKHITGGKILSITQPSLERILRLEIEHYNEMGDLCKKQLIIEMMGKHSNIIFTEGTKIIDSIKHISALISSVREVLPGREYFIPFEGEKLDPFQVDREQFAERIFSKDNYAQRLGKALYMNLTGFSPSLSEEILYRAGLDSDRPVSSLSDDEKETLFSGFQEIMSLLTAHNFCPNIVYQDKEPINYAPFHFKVNEGQKTVDFSSASELLYTYYAEKQAYTSIRQKTADLRQVVTGLLHKDNKKYDLQLKQLKDTEKRDKYRVYGDLLTTYGYSVEPKATSFRTIDYNTGNEITIPLDPSMSAIDNAKKFYEKYSKMKRTAEALSGIIKDTKEEIDHLESIAASLETVKDQADIAELKKEMTDAGYIRAHNDRSQKGKKQKPGKAPKNQMPKSSPLHYLSSDGFDIYVGKNNFQNEYLAFKVADGSDWWFHAKKIPGSHVIIKANGAQVPDRTMEEAARLAAHFSKAFGTETVPAGGKVEIDYLQRKHLKKTPGGKPGFVIYHTNYSMTASTDISDIREA